MKFGIDKVLLLGCLGLWGGMLTESSLRTFFTGYTFFTFISLRTSVTSWSRWTGVTGNDCSYCWFFGF